MAKEISTAPHVEQHKTIIEHLKKAATYHEASAEHHQTISDAHTALASKATGASKVHKNIAEAHAALAKLHSGHAKDLDEIRENLKEAAGSEATDETKVDHGRFLKALSGIEA
jgi:hypothetical protein